MSALGIVTISGVQNCPFKDSLIEKEILGFAVYETWNGIAILPLVSWVALKSLTLSFRVLAWKCLPLRMSVYRAFRISPESESM